MEWLGEDRTRNERISGKLGVPHKFWGKMTGNRFGHNMRRV